VGFAGQPSDTASLIGRGVRRSAVASRPPPLQSAKVR
jgi:hypothetical protein